MTKSTIALCLLLGASSALLPSTGFAQPPREGSSHEKAIRECSVRAGQFSNASQQTQQFYAYDAYMSEQNYNE